MYRIQLSGNEYVQNREIGLHYQTHRGLGIHHQKAIDRQQPLKVNIFVGGPPSLTLAAIMPLPEGMPELAFAGLLGGHRLPLVKNQGGLPFPAEADFVICGSIDPDMRKPEGPFGDHIGYYSLAHDFRSSGLIASIIGRTPSGRLPRSADPPQEDTSFGAFIHELTGDLIPSVLPGVRAVHAVDAAGVHPLLLAIGSERYTPYADLERPQELLTQANAIYGQGQLSLAKYLLIAAENDNPQLDIHDIPAVFSHVLERFDPARDIHFQTESTIDTLDYSGHGLNQGSKVTIAAVGRKKRPLPTDIPVDLALPDGFSAPRMAQPGILLIKGPPCTAHQAGENAELLRFCANFDRNAPINRFPLLIIVDDSEFCSQTLNNWLWVTFTRSDPASDLYGIDSFVHAKHWGCHGSLVIDARSKPHHAPPLIEDPAIEKEVDKLGEKGGPLYGII